MQTRLAYNYLESPIEIASANGDVETLPPDRFHAFGLPSELASDILRWNSLYRDTYTNDPPPGGGFKCSSCIELHNMLGRRLAQEMANNIQRDVVFRYYPALEAITLSPNQHIEESLPSSGGRPT